MTGKYLNKILLLGAEHALYREDGKWYHNLKRFPGILFDKNGYILFKNEKAYLSHPHLQVGTELHVKHGIKDLSGYIRFTEQQQKSINTL